MEHLPLIAIEVVMIFGGAVAFGWWQLRDLDREKRKREQQKTLERSQTREPESVEAPPDAPQRAQAALPSEGPERPEKPTHAP